MPTNHQDSARPISGSDFSERLLLWFDREGRKNLPWQQNPTPYRVWLSEVMLQQTQVATVIPYFERFTERYPTIFELAAAPDDQVMHLWTGLGYYARARNLLKTARLIVAEHAGQFPDTVEGLTTLPGIGKSTAGAILSLAMKKRAPILDGNVKRVLCRHYAVTGWPDQSATLKQLWALTEQVTPTSRVADYTQGIMDLGATVCTRASPQCGACPLATTCLAFESHTQHLFPEKKTKKKLPTRETRVVIPQRTDGSVRMERRPERGIWGGLWSFSELPAEVDATQWWRNQEGSEPGDTIELAAIAHTFSHFHLVITPILLKVDDPTPRVAEVDSCRWVDPRVPEGLGLPAPIVRLLALLTETKR